MERRTDRRISVPSYTLGEELCSAVTHGLGAELSAGGLALLLVKARGALPITAVSVFGVSMIALYTISCVYHALPPGVRAKGQLRVLDHCVVYLLVWGTYVPVSLLGIRGVAGWTLFGLVSVVTVAGIVFNCLDLEKYQAVQLVCNLCCGWLSLTGVSRLLANTGTGAVVYLLLGGLMYSLGAVLYVRGAKKPYRHSVFHVFCLLGTFFHFWVVYRFIL